MRINSAALIGERRIFSSAPRIVCNAIRVAAGLEPLSDLAA